MADAERILSQLRDVQAASITTDGDEIREVHIVAISARTPKQIVRDVETALKAFLKRAIDHRIISVALQQPGQGFTAPTLTVLPPPSGSPAANVAGSVLGTGGAGGVSAAGAATAATVAQAPSGGLGSFPPVPSIAPGGRGGSGGGAASGHGGTMPPGVAPPSIAAGASSTAATGTRRPDQVPRVRFVTANLFVSGLRTQAQVELSWQGVTRLGNATGASARDNAHRLLSSATLQALLPYLGDDVTLAPHEVEFVRLGRQEVVVVTVKLLAQRSEKTLVGSCTVEQDVAQSVVYATLAAVNRVLGGLRPREPVEYELRPTST
ncbi:MAG: hypothetical protein ACREOU_04695 [Candidatus Eiseniibacteriota bacterium]